MNCHCTLVESLNSLCPAQCVTITHYIREDAIGGRHVAKSYFVASVVRDGEDSSDVVVSVAKVTFDVIKDDFVSNVDNRPFAQHCIECHL